MDIMDIKILELAHPDISFEVVGPLRRGKGYAIIGLRGESPWPDRPWFSGQWLGKGHWISGEYDLTYVEALKDAAKMVREGCVAIEPPRKPKKAYKCSKCGGTGHYRSTCRLSGSLTGPL